MNVDTDSHLLINQEINKRNKIQYDKNSKPVILVPKTLSD